MKRLNKFLSIVLLLTMVSSNTFIVTAQSLTQPTRLDSQTTSSQLPGDSPEDKGIDLPSQPILESDKGKIIGPVEPALPTDPVKDPITPPPVFTTRVPIETTQTPEPSQEPTEAAPEEPQPTTTPTPEAPGEQLIDVTAIVKWSFGPSTRPTIWLKLYRNVQGGPVTAVEDAPVKMLSGSATMATWAKMPSADENGKKYEYSVKQVDASGNPLILDAYTTSISGLTVMNVFKTGQTKTIVANLVWKDNPLAKGGIIDWLAHKLEAPTVYFQLMQVSGESTIPTVVPGAPLIMMESGTLQASWPNMPVEDADRNLITYSVKQVDASGQPFSPKGFTTTEDGLTVTNVYTDPAGFGQIMGVPNPIACGPFSPQAGYTVTFPINTSTNSHTVLKLMWVSGDQYHIALVATHATQSATINGVSLSFVGSCDILVPLTVGGVTYPATGASGNTKDSRWVIYSAPLSSLGLGDTGNSLYVQGIGGGHDLNTSFGVSINKIAVTATKVWVGGMEDSVTAYLMVDGVRDETSGKTLAASEWKATWTNLDEITMAGRFIIYSVQEDPVPAGYEVSYSGGPYNHTITNTKKATLELKKIWVGTPGSVYLNIGTTEYGTEIASQLTTDTILTTGPKPVAPGTYYFSETNGPNTDLSDYISTFNCTVTPAGANVNAVMPSIIMPDNIVLEAGESAVCTYTNTQRAKIVVDKVTEPAGSRQSFSFTTSGSGYNNFSLKDTDPANSQIVDSGHYTVSETVPPGWKQKSAVCVSSIGSAQAPDNINIVAGETVTCTFTNIKRGNLILRKMTDPVTDPKLVKFTFYHPKASGISLLGHGEQISSRDLDPGAYTFTEKVPAGWSLSSVVCDDERSATPSTFDLAAGTATFNIDPGETVICTFTNSQNGSIELKKVWEGEVGSVNLTIGSASGGSDIANVTTDDTVLTTGAKSVAPGTYYLGETGNGTDLSLYASTLVCSVNGAPATASDGSVYVGTGDTVVCTYTNTQRAKIVVDKVTEPAGSGQSFSFTTSGSGYNNFSLKDTDPANSQMVDPGQYSVSETLPPGWDQKTVACVSSIGSEQRPDNINIAAGETVTCTFTNIQLGSIIVEKLTNPATATDKFTFTGNAAGTIGHGETIVIPNLVPGTYTSTETVPAGWALSSIVCDDNNSSGSTENGKATFNLEAGEIVKCTFTNTQYGSIELKKVWEGEVGSVNLTIGSASGGSDIANVTTDDTVLTTGAKSVAPGTYYLGETGNGTDLSLYASTLVCSVNGAPATASDGSVNVGPGETVVCTYTNTQHAKIVVDKVTEPAGSGQSFSFTTSGSGYNNFSLKDTDPANSQMVDPGQYSVSETLPPGWDQKSVACVSSIGSKQTPDNINIAAGETVTCTFTNTQRGGLIVQKLTDPVTDPELVKFTFSGFGGSSLGRLGHGQNFTTNNLAPGSYTFTELEAAGWDLTSIVCDDGESSTPSTFDLDARTATFNIDAGETVTCTFTNTQRGKIIVRKVTNPDTDTTTSFNFLAFGGAYTNFSLVNGGSNEQVLPPGDYSFAEAMKNGWELTGNTCTSSIAGKTQVSTAIALEAGEVVDCTITNTKYGRIIVEKKSLPFWSLQEFEFTGDIIGSIFTGRVVSTANLLPGTYTTTEVAKDGWKLTDITCNDNGKSSGDVETRTATYHLKAGEEIRCVFTNTQLGEISIAKVTDPSGATQKFDFTGLFDGVSLSDGETSTKTFLDPGEYNFAESPVNGWELTSIYCRNLTPPPQLCDLTAAAGITEATVDLDNRSVSVDLQPSDNFLCTFTNKYTGGDPIDINGIKTWTGVPEGAALPAITIRLWQNNVEIDSIELTGEPWTYSFLGLPTYDMDGQIYRYKVTEDPINGYQTVQDGYNFENIYDGGSGTPTEISGKKTWVVPEGSELPASITIRLHRDGVEVAQQTITAPWTYIFSGLPTFDTDGKPFVYTVSEDPIPGYDTVQTGYDFKNTYDPELIDVSGIKTWTVPEGSKLPASITIRLYRDGTEIDSKAVNDPWTYSFTGLPKHGTNGIEHVYTVTEDPIPGYTTEQDGYNFENIYNGGFGIPTEVTAVKVWVGGPQTHPTIQFQLYRNGVKLGAPITLVNGVTSFTWTGLESLDTQGNPYVYTVDEVFVPANYVKSVSGLTITNTYRSPEIPYTGDDQVALIAGLIALFGLIGFVSMRLLKKKYQAD